MTLFNPFEELKPEKLVDLMDSGLSYLAAQHFKRAFPYYSPTNRTGILVTAYPYEVYARQHLENVEDARYASCINLNHRSHYAKMLDMLGADSPYIVYCANRKDMDEILKLAVPRFEAPLKAWLNREVDINPIITIKQHMQIQIKYGELYIVMGEGHDQLNIKLDIIENN